MSKQQKKTRSRTRYRNDPSAIPPGGGRVRSFGRRVSQGARKRMPQDKDALRRVVTTGLGAAIGAAAGALMVRLAPPTWTPLAVATGITGASGVLAYRQERPAYQQLASGAMAAAGAQAMLLAADNRYERVVKDLEYTRRAEAEARKKATAEKTAAAVVAAAADRKPANANGVAPGALESAFNAARSHMAITGDDFDIA